MYPYFTIRLPSHFPYLFTFPLYRFPLPSFFIPPGDLVLLFIHPPKNNRFEQVSFTESRMKIEEKHRRKKRTVVILGSHLTGSRSNEWKRSPQKSEKRSDTGAALVSFLSTRSLEARERVFARSHGRTPPTWYAGSSTGIDELFSIILSADQSIRSCKTFRG